MKNSIRKISSYLGISIVIFLFSQWFENTILGKELFNASWSFIQNIMNEDEDEIFKKIVIVNIEEIPSNEKITQREPLRKLVEEVIDQGPLAIGMAIAFNVDEDHKRLTPKESNFIQKLQLLKNPRKIPIFLGVNEDGSVKSPPGEWFGTADWDEFAATIAFARKKKDTRKIIREIVFEFEEKKFEEKKKILPSLSKRLYDAYSDHQNLNSVKCPRISKDTFFHNPLFESTSNKIKEKEMDIQVNSFWVDYSKVKEYTDDVININYLGNGGKEAAQYINSIDKKKLKGKIVIIGTVSENEASHTILGPESGIPGAVIHAAGVYTLIKGPVRIFSTFAKVVFDIGLSIIIVIFIVPTIHRIIAKKFHRKLDDSRAEAALIFLCALIFCCIGIIYAAKTRIMWNDFIIMWPLMSLTPWISKCIYSGCNHIGYILSKYFIKGKIENE